MGSTSTDFLLAQRPLSPESGTHSKHGANAYSKDKGRKEGVGVERWESEGKVLEGRWGGGLESGFSCF